MAISDIVASMKQNLANVYDKLAEKGVELPAQKNLANLAAAIDTLQPAPPQDWGKVYTAGSPGGIALTTEAEFKGLCTNSNGAIVVGSSSIIRNAITGYTFGPDCPKDIPSYFLANFTGLTRPIVLPEGTTTLGSHFMLNCTSYAESLVLPDTITIIADYFMYHCDVFPGILTFNCPASVLTGNNSLLMSNMQPSFNPGIKVNGPYASEWVARLPISAGGGRYRKLVVVD